MNDSAPSFSQAAWKRLKKNNGAIAGLFMILIAVVVALFSYLIAPDPSPYANRIILEIGGEKPGFTQQFLLVKNRIRVPRHSLAGLFPASLINTIIFLSTHLPKKVTASLLINILMKVYQKELHSQPLHWHRIR